MTEASTPHLHQQSYTVAFLQHILDTLPLEVYVVDPNTMTVLCANKHTSLPPDMPLTETSQCYRVFKNRTRPCTYCPVLHLMTQETPPGYTKTTQEDCSGQLNIIHVAQLTLATGIQACLVARIPLTRNSQQEDIFPHLDECTGIPNNQSYETKAALLLDNAVQQGTGAAFFALKIAGLHHINSVQGYHHGDEALRKIIQAVATALPPGVFFARRRGNDFSIFYPRTQLDSTQEIHALLKKLESAIETSCSPEMQNWIKIRFGISLCPEHGLAFEALNRKARQAVIMADRSKDRFAANFYDDALISRLRDREELLLDLSLAIRRNEMELVFQPKHEILSATIVGAEALIRWNHPSRGQVCADLFIPLAEESLTIPMIDTWVITEVCRQWRRLLDQGYPMVPVSINISPQKFYQPDFIERLCAPLEEYHIPASMVEIELTERTALQDIDKAISIMQRIRAKGFQVSIDDFGTGYSSLNYLRTLPFDTVKLDRSFIADAGDKTQDTLKAIVGLVKVYDATVLFEGIETEQQYQLARDVGCDLIQGYYTGRPMRPDCLADILERQAALSGLKKALELRTH